VDEQNEQVGIVETDDARQRARDAGLDLVEVAPNSKPPVCRIMDYGKWKYAQRKKEQKAKSHAKQAEIKGVRLRPKIDDHDLHTKLKKARDFLGDGNKVQFTMLFRGREMAHRDLGQQQMNEICDELGDVAKVEAAPKMMGRRMTMLLTPDRKQKNPDKQAKGQQPAEGEQANGQSE
jgi:translation initiation factor IF-3